MNAVGGIGKPGEGNSDMPPNIPSPFKEPEWELEQPIVPLFAADQPLVDALVSIIRKVWETPGLDIDLPRNEEDLLVRIVRRR